MEAETSVLEFAGFARHLATASRAAGLVTPAFRSPPRRTDARRTIRRYPGGATVSIRVRGRSPVAVAEDMVDGVLVANDKTGADALRLRGALLRAVIGSGSGAVAAA